MLGSWTGLEFISVHVEPPPDQPKPVLARAQYSRSISDPELVPPPLFRTLTYAKVGVEASRKTGFSCWCSFV
jgi:hypothetical protein